MPLIIPSNRLASTGYTIDQSLRFDAAATVNLIDSSVGAGDTRKKNTFSVWLKRGIITTQQYIGAYRHNATNYQYWLFKADDTLEFTDVSGGSVIGKLVTTQVFRDPSAWYNLTFVWDTANDTPAQRMIIYVNGQRVTSFSTETYPSINTDSGGAGRASSDIRIGTYDATGAFFDGYMTNIVYIDNGALDASSFGETNENGIWVPIDVSGLGFGARGFYVDGRDASDLGDDESGNSNDFSSGLSAHDQVSDSPTNNFATFNSVYADVTGFTDVTFKNGNLQADATSSQFDHTVSTFNLPKSGKWYFEHYLGGRYTGFGICIVGQEASISSGYSFGSLSTAQGFGFQDNVVYNGNSATVTFGGQSSLGDILNCAFDVDNNKVFLGINGTYYAADNGNDGNPSAGTNPTVTTSFSLSTNDIILGFYFSTADGTSFVNFGQEGTFGGNKTAGGNSDANGIGNFFNTVPTSYLALCSKNVGS
ncbi:hypothetical protein [Marinobacter sp.]|uniref:hypothetical protein n=1 Tax=Marinobacter sp. TaxID=50741 RepID=UPI002357AB64|nr:hypothetical protein [Marinobacter sp.]